jgi:hypothetical protein
MWLLLHHSELFFSVNMHICIFRVPVCTVTMLFVVLLFELSSRIHLQRISVAHTVSTNIRKRNRQLNWQNRNEVSWRLVSVWRPWKMLCSLWFYIPFPAVTDVTLFASLVYLKYFYIFRKQFYILKFLPESKHAT